MATEQAPADAKPGDVKPADSILGPDEKLVDGTVKPVESLLGPDENKVAADKAKAEAEKAALTPEQKAAADKVAADEAKKNAVPEKYADFKLPDGVKLDEATLAEAVPMFKELGLSQDKAQKAVDFWGKQRAKDVADHQKRWDEFQTNWINEAKKDPEYGGAKFQDSQGKVRNAIRSLSGSPEQAQKVVEALKLTGAGNNPEIFRLLYRAGVAIGEDKINLGGAPKGAKKGFAELVYNNPGTAAQ